MASRGWRGPSPAPGRRHDPVPPGAAARRPAALAAGGAAARSRPAAGPPHGQRASHRRGAGGRRPPRRGGHPRSRPGWRGAGGSRRCCRGSPPRCATRSATTGWSGCRGPARWTTCARRRAPPSPSTPPGSWATWWPPPARRRRPRRRWPGPGGATRRCSQATALYFERRHRLLALLADPPPDARARVEAELELARVTAELDALTGGLPWRSGGREPRRTAAGAGRGRARRRAGGAARLRPAGARAAHPDRRLVARAGPAWRARRWSPWTSPVRSPPRGWPRGSWWRWPAPPTPAPWPARWRRASRPARWPSPPTPRSPRAGAASSCARWRRSPAGPPTRWWWPRRCATSRGAPVLDPEGHRRTFVGTFTTVAGPPPRPVLTEVRAVAATPQAGGEYVELLNLGEEPLDLSGWRLEKRTSTGSLAGCTVAAAADGAAAGRLRPADQRGLGRPLPGCRPAPSASPAGRRRWRAASPTTGRPRSGCSIRPGRCSPPSARAARHRAARPRWSGSTRWRRTSRPTWPARWTRGRPAGATR